MHTNDFVEISTENICLKHIRSINIQTEVPQIGILKND